MNSSPDTKDDYANFHKSETDSTFAYDIHGQVGRSYANGRFKVLADISEGCEPILRVKIFSRRRFPSRKAVGNKCLDKLRKRDQTRGKNFSKLKQPNIQL